MLTKMRQSNYVIVPTGLNSDQFKDFWLHLSVKFNPESADVEVSNWWLTDSWGAPVSLSSLSYDDVQHVAHVMSEEFTFHRATYYHEVELAYYSRKLKPQSTKRVSND